MPLRTSLAARTPVVRNTRGHEPVVTAKPNSAGDVSLDIAHSDGNANRAPRALTHPFIIHNSSFIISPCRPDAGGGADLCRFDSVRLGTKQRYPGVGSQYQQ